jgi:hypothetical protein
MASYTDDRATVRKAPSLVRDGVACLVLFVVGNVSVSVTWERYFGDDSTQRRLSLLTYAATPIALETEPPVDEPRRLPVSCATESGLDRPNVQDEREFDLEDHAAKPAKSVPNYSCPNGMRFVAGMYCSHAVHKCLDFLSEERDRCQKYVADSPCIGTQTPMQFCIDEFEYPNQPGAKPMVWVNYQQAVAFCASVNKRLCSGSEWELACEGPDHLPYATGYRRDPTRCNYDRPNISADHAALANPSLRNAEFDRIDQREPSGARPDCVSYYGVHDMTGNVDEWVTNEGGFMHKAPYRSGLKGGYWGRVRNRCRPTTTDHNEWHSDYQVGFRCCTESLTAYAANR